MTPTRTGAFVAKQAVLGGERQNGRTDLVRTRHMRRPRSRANTRESCSTPEPVDVIVAETLQRRETAA